jgi:hypothetical protein
MQTSLMSGRSQAVFKKIHGNSEFQLSRDGMLLFLSVTRFSDFELLRAGQLISL